MMAKCARILLLAVLACSVEASENKELEVVEARGKVKYALLIHFLWVVATKLFVLKMVYGAIFYALICKGWHFFSWFIHYLKEKHTIVDDHELKEYLALHEYLHSHDHHGHNHYGHDIYGHNHYGHDIYGLNHYGHDIYGHNHYGQDSYEPYAYDKHGYSDKSIKNGDKKMYDADGSYSVKS